MRTEEQVLKSAPGTLVQPVEPVTGVGRTEVRVNGQTCFVPSVQIEGRTVITDGKWLKIAAVQDEEVVESEAVQTPRSFIALLKGSGLKADIFTFSQKLPDTRPHYDYHQEWESLAVIPIVSYTDWWEKRAKYDVRSAVKKSVKRGIVTREVRLDDKFIEGIVAIYNETPIRQGKLFWHYNKDFATVKQMTCTYMDRSIFIGAYYENELVGFIKMVRVGNVARTFHVISMTKYFNKKPTNALIAKAVEICASNQISHLVYGNFVDGYSKSSLTEFKERNGFQEVLVPRYYVPLTVKGRLVLKTKLHRGLRNVLPQNVYRLLLGGRSLMLRTWKAGVDR